MASRRQRNPSTRMPSHYSVKPEPLESLQSIEPVYGMKDKPVSSSPPSNSKVIARMADDQDREVFGVVMETVRSSGAILCPHDVPDADAFGAAYAVRAFFQTENIPTTIVAERIIPNSDLLLLALGISPVGWDSIRADDLRPIITLDTSSRNTFRKGAERKNRVILSIDHHYADQAKLEPVYRIINRQAGSTCGIVASLIPGELIDPLTALALAAGISCDTQRLLTADDETLRLFRRLRRISKVPRHRIDELAFPSLKRDVLATLIAELSSIRSVVYNERVIAVCMTAIKPPAIMVTLMREMDIDISAALSPLSHRRFQLSLRVNQKNAFEYGIKAHELARSISSRCGSLSKGEVGGHDDMAGGTLPGQYEDIVDHIIAAVREAVDKALAKP